VTELSFRAQVQVIDANVGVGHRHDRPAPFEDADGLLAEMDRHGVDKAVVYHVQGESVSALDGNDLLHRWAADEPRLIPQWVAGSDPACLRQLEGLLAEGRLSSLRLHDTLPSHAPLTDWMYGDLLAWAQSEALPLWVSLADNDIVQLADTLGCYAELECVLVGAHYVHAALVRPLMRHLPRSVLELSRNETVGDVERLAQEVGARRLLYGSFYPRYAMGPMLFYLHRCDLSPDQLQLICAGNARRLLRLEGAS
jgi:hypothetical protein